MSCYITIYVYIHSNCIYIHTRTWWFTRVSTRVWGELTPLHWTEPPTGYHKPSYWKWPIEIVDLPIKNGWIYPVPYVKFYQRVRLINLLLRISADNRHTRYPAPAEFKMNGVPRMFFWGLLAAKILMAIGFPPPKKGKIANQLFRKIRLSPPILGYHPLMKTAW